MHAHRRLCRCVCTCQAQKRGTLFQLLSILFKSNPPAAGQFSMTSLLHWNWQLRTQPTAAHNLFGSSHQSSDIALQQINMALLACGSFNLDRAMIWHIINTHLWFLSSQDMWQSFSSIAHGANKQMNVSFIRGTPATSMDGCCRGL